RVSLPLLPCAHPLFLHHALPLSVSPPAPVSGATVSGSAATVSATASDNVGVAGVQFTLDGTPLGAEMTSAPTLSEAVAETVAAEERKSTRLNFNPRSIPYSRLAI